MRILSGIQPSGETHLGNFFGAMRQHVALQTEGEAIYFVADYHSMTSVRDAAERRRLVREVALDYLACGLDPKRAMLYRQSDLTETCELAWMLTTVTPMGLLQRAHSYKDKIAQGMMGGLFVLEAVSVIVQVVSYRLTGKRVFRMAPLHHHFEQKGWTEPQIVIRFWIISVVLALLGLSTLKLR